MPPLAKGLRIQIVQCLHRLWTLHSCGARKRNGRRLAHMHPLPLYVQIIYTQLWSSILSRLHTMKATLFIQIASHKKLSSFIVNKCILPSVILKLAHSNTHTYASCKHIHMVLAQARPHNALHSFSIYHENNCVISALGMERLVISGDHENLLSYIVVPM